MAEVPVRVAKTKRVSPDEMGARLRQPVKPEMLGGDAVKPEQVMDSRPERSVPIDEYSARDRFSSSEPYDPSSHGMSGGEVTMDALRSIPTGLTHLAESLPGIPGDLADLKYDLARYLNNKTGLSHYSDTPRKVIDWMQEADPSSRFLPTTDEIAENVTDPVLEATGTKDVMRYQPKSPFGQAVDTGAQQLDVPLGWMGKIPKIAAKMLKRGGPK